MIRSSEPAPILVSGRSEAPTRRLQRLRARIRLRKRLTLSTTPAGGCRPAPARNAPSPACPRLEEEGAGELEPGRGPAAVARSACSGRRRWLRPAARPAGVRKYRASGTRRPRRGRDGRSHWGRASRHSPSAGGWRAPRRTCAGGTGCAPRPDRRKAMAPGRSWRPRPGAASRRQATTARGRQRENAVHPGPCWRRKEKEDGALSGATLSQELKRVGSGFQDEET